MWEPLAAKLHWGEKTSIECLTMRELVYWRKGKSKIKSSWVRRQTFGWNQQVNCSLRWTTVSLLTVFKSNIIIWHFRSKEKSCIAKQREACWDANINFQHSILNSQIVLMLMWCSIIFFYYYQCWQTSFADKNLLVKQTIFFVFFDA